MNRRGLIVGAAAALLAPALRTGAAPSAAQAKRLENRTDLWANYAKRTRNLMARLTTTRETSLLDQPLVVTGALVFRASSKTLVLRDDGLTGSTTVVEPDRVVVVPNQSELPRGPALDPDRMAAARWLGDRLLGLFTPGEPDALLADARVNVPKGKGYRIELLPPRGSAARQVIRSITIHLDPVAGAVTHALIAEAQGDRLLLQITDHRQNVDDADVDRVIDAARDLMAGS